MFDADRRLHVYWSPEVRGYGISGRRRLAGRLRGCGCMISGEGFFTTYCC